jgi:hypothetical protein
MRTMRFTLLTAVALAFLVTLTTEASATGHQIEGVWDVEVTLIPDCMTPRGTVRAMIMFTRDRKVIETAGTPLVGAFAIHRVSPGLGEWERQGRRHYTAAFTFFRINVPGVLTPFPPPDPLPDPLPPFSFAGTQTITEDIELSHDGNEFTATGTSQIVNADGTRPPATCNTLTGIRRN